MTRLTLLPKAAETTVQALVDARNAARQEARRFSRETWSSWRDLEHEIDLKLEDAERRLALGGPSVRETVAARLTELRSAIDSLLRRHSHREVHSLMTPEPKTCRLEDTLDLAAAILWNSDCGAVPVVDAQGKLRGMITDRDICMAVWSRGVPISECTVESTMAHAVKACAPDCSVQDVAELMMKYQLRRIPVTDADGKLLGIVTIADLARYFESLPEDHPARALLVSIVAAVSAPRR